MELAIYGRPTSSYKEAVPRFGFGDVIRHARRNHGWNQTQLGQEASKFVIADPRPINKSTVSKVERDPYSSEFGTVWRLMAALDLSFTEIEREVAPPFKKTEEQQRASRTAGGSR